jgi:hypothetical protein
MTNHDSFKNSNEGTKELSCHYSRANTQATNVKTIFGRLSFYFKKSTLDARKDM